MKHKAIKLADGRILMFTDTLAAMAGTTIVDHPDNVIEVEAKEVKDDGKKQFPKKD